MKVFRLIRSEPADACYNMALDEALFTRYLKDRVPVLRVYRWRSPSFTYGVSQTPEAALDVKKCLADGIEIARRMTGGGILFHNDEITYSLACAKEDVGEPKESLVSYSQICAFLIRFYESLGLTSCFAHESEHFQRRRAPHDLCSASHEKYDIVINGKKIGGHAQKRKRDAVFQHGSIPCSIDWDFVRSYAPLLPQDISSGATTLYEELQKVPDKKTLEERLIESFASTFNVSFNEEKEIMHETCMA